MIDVLIGLISLLCSILVVCWALIPCDSESHLLIEKLTHGPGFPWIGWYREGKGIQPHSIFHYASPTIYTKTQSLLLFPSFSSPHLTFMCIPAASFEKGLEKKRGWRRMSSSLDLVAQIALRAPLLVFITFYTFQQVSQKYD